MRSLRGSLVTAALAAALFVVRTADAAPMLGVQFGSSGTLWDVDPATGQSSNPRNTNVFNPVGLAVSPVNGQIYTTGTGSLGGWLYTIDPVTGGASTVSNTNISLVEGAITFNPAGTLLYAGMAGGSGLVTINPANGQVTSLGNPAGADDISALAFHNGNFYALDTKVNSGRTPRLYTLNPATAQVLNSVDLSMTFTSPLAALAAMTVDPFTNQLYVAFDGPQTLYTLNPTTGVLTAVGPLTFPSVSGLAFIPEPTSAAALALAATFASLRRRRQ